MEITCHFVVSLFLLTMLSFGSHFARNSLSIYSLYMIDDNFITPSGMGLMLSICFLPAIFIPVISGYFVDRHSTRNWMVWFLLVLALVGQVFLLIAVAIKWYLMVLIALFIFGSGASSITSIQRSMVAIYFPEKESFSMGMTIAVASIAKLCGKVTVVPVVVRELYIQIVENE